MHKFLSKCVLISIKQRNTEVFYISSELKRSTINVLQFTSASQLLLRLWSLLGSITVHKFQKRIQLHSRPFGKYKYSWNIHVFSSNLSFQSAVILSLAWTLVTLSAHLGLNLFHRLAWPREKMMCQMGTPCSRHGPITWVRRTGSKYVTAVEIGWILIT
jgi:hypothetical protein